MGDKLKEIKELESGLSYDKYKYLEDKHIEWLIEQAEFATKYRNSLENISEILDGQFATELVERIAYELVHSGIYDKEKK